MSDFMQLRRGALATVLLLLAALGICQQLDPQWLAGWVTVALVVMVPAQIVLSLLLGCAHPASLARLPQPWRGLGFLALNAALGASVALVAWGTVGGQAATATPFLLMYLILAVPVALWLVVICRGWPLLHAGHSPLVQGLLVWLACYLLTWAIYRLGFDFSSLAGAPFYRPELDPAGAFPAWTPLVFSIACVVPMLGLLLFDFWPLSALAARSPRWASAGGQAWLASVVVLLVAGGLWWLWVGHGMDSVVFMVRICVAFNFGCFVILVMFAGCPALRWPQPWRGLLLTLVAAVFGAALLALYEVVAGWVGPLASGAPTYEYELWLASAMLAVSFPLLVCGAAYFQFWPLSLGAAERE